MNAGEERILETLAAQSAEWFVANDDGPLDERAAAALVAWLKRSPVHVEELLGVSLIARDLKSAGADPNYSLEAILARARVEEDPRVCPHPAARRLGALRLAPARRGFGGMAWAACAMLGMGLYLSLTVKPAEHPPAAAGLPALHFETRHGERLQRRLADDSILHLDTDSALTVRYSKTERLIVLTAGQAAFEVAHESGRAFRVLAGSAEVIDRGTRFDVRLDRDSTVVTVLEGRVAVVPLLRPEASAASALAVPRAVELHAGEQLRVVNGEWPAAPRAVNAQSITAWLTGRIVFDREPLEGVASEFNRYAPTPVEVVSPALRTLQISGVFAADDTEAFVAFLRSLEGARVEVSAARIRVSGD